MASKEEVVAEVAEGSNLGPQNASRNVYIGDDVTVTIPKAAAEVLLNPVGRTLAESSDAQAILRAALGA